MEASAAAVVISSQRCNANQTLNDPRGATLTSGSLPSPSATPAAAATAAPTPAPTPAAPAASGPAPAPAAVPVGPPAAAQAPDAGAVHAPPHRSLPAAMKSTANNSCSVVHQQLETPSSSFFDKVTEVGRLADVC